MAQSLFRRMGGPALILAGALMGGAVTGIAMANQPHMQNALSDLNAARNQLNIAVPDKGGHRDNALNLVNQAIGQVQAGIAYAGGK
ncbi:MAG: hypothetical protein ACLQPV_06690 [Vulcanimicrobiaceae bacterium]